VTTPGRAARALAHVRLLMLVNALRSASARRKVAWSVFAIAMVAYAIQMAKVAATMTPDPATAVSVVSAAFAALAAFTAVRVGSASIQWVADAPDIRLLGALPTPPSALFAAHFGAVLAEAARMQILAIPIVVGCAVASEAAVPWVVAYAVGWVCVVVGVSAAGSAGGVFVARWIRPTRARFVFRLLSLGAAIAVFGAFMVAADLGGRRAGRELARFANAPDFLAWLPTSWVAALLFDGGWTNFLGVAAFAVVATVAAGRVFARWFDVDSAVSSAYAFGPARGGAAASAVRAPRAAFVALVVKDLRSSFRSATVITQWAGPIVLILVYARVRGGSAGPVLAAGVVNIVALVASMTVGHGLAREEADAGWVIRLNSRKNGQATLAKLAIVWAVTTLTCLAALGVVVGGGGMWPAGAYALWLALGHAAFGLAVERAAPGAKKAGKRATPGLLGVIARQVYTGVAVLTAGMASMGAPWLVALPPLVGLVALVLAERHGPVEARRW
jgi:hypothetical protein